MTVHDYHNDLPGYSPDQILHDGCPECERRGADVFEALCHLDRPQWERTWRRATALHCHGLSDASDAELPMLRVLIGVQLCMERYAGLPFGDLPTPFNGGGVFLEPGA